MGADRETGFTLIELIAVLVLIGLLLVFAPMGIEGLIPERKLEAEVSRLATVIETLCQQAMLDQARFAIHYDTENDRYAPQVPEEVVRDNPDRSDKPLRTLVLERDPDVADLDWHPLPEGITIELYEGKRRIRGRFMVTINPDGTVPAHSIVFESNKVPSLEEEDRMRTVTVTFPGLVSYATGRVLDDYRKTEAELVR